jgi:hypothetical protein
MQSKCGLANASPEILIIERVCRLPDRIKTTFEGALS